MIPKCERLRIMTVTPVNDNVTFDFKGTRMRCVVSGSLDKHMQFRWITFLNDHS